MPLVLPSIYDQHLANVIDYSIFGCSPTGFEPVLSKESKAYMNLHPSVDLNFA